MAEEEYYYNEKPETGDTGGTAGGSNGGTGGQGPGGGGGSGGGGGWGNITYGPGGDGGSGGGGGWNVTPGTRPPEPEPGEDDPDDWFWITEGGFRLPPVLLESPDGFLLESPDGRLLLGNTGCVSIGIECRINDGKTTHRRCLLIRWEIEAEPADSFQSALDKLFANAALPNGTIIVKARWQSGHWNVAEVHSVQFRCEDFTTDWIALPLEGDYVTVLKIKLKNGQITVS